MNGRDVVAHHYGSLDLELVWNTSVDDIQDLKKKLKDNIELKDVNENENS